MLIDEIDFNVALNKLKKESIGKFCYYGLDCGKSNIIRAHSLQESRILKKISLNGDVLHVEHEIKENELSFKFEKIGKGKASTFTGFCKTHDNDLFLPIEVKDYQIGNVQQNFLYSYRALAVGHFHKKYHEKFMSIIYNSITNNDLDTLYSYIPKFNNFSEKFLIKLEIMLDVLSKRNIKLDKLRASFNMNLKNNSYHNLKTKLIVFEEEYHISCSSYLILNQDIYGNKLSNNHCNPLFISVFPENGKTFILLSYLKKDENFYAYINNQILNQKQEIQKIILSNIIVKYISNFYISPIRWDELSLLEKEKTERYLNEYLNETDNKNLIEGDLNIFL